MLTRGRRIVPAAVAGSAALAGVLLILQPDGSGPIAAKRAAGTAPGSPASAPLAGWPNAGNTGTPRGTPLRRIPGRAIHRNGTVLDGVDIRGPIDVYANNVTIRNCRLISSDFAAIILRERYTDLRVENCTIHGDGVHRMQYGIMNLGKGFVSIRRNNIHTCSNCIDSDVGLIEDNFVHHPKYFAGDHTDMIMCEGGAPAGKRLVIRHNTVINTQRQTGAIALFADFSPVQNVLVERNLLAGGGYALYGGMSGPHGPATRNVIVRGNVFSRRIWPRGGFAGPVAYFDLRGRGNVWRNNIWQDTRAPVRP